MTARADIRARALLLAAVAAMIASLTPARAAITAQVTAQSFSFVPQDVTINVGDSVRWFNRDITTHTLTDLTCARAGGNGVPCEFNHDLTPDTEFTQPFQTAGVYAYKCVIHDIFGSVTVHAPGSPLPDLVVDAITFSTPSPTVTRITATIRNASTVAGAPRSEVVFSYRYNGELRRIAKPLGNSLPAGASQQVNALWTTTGKIGDFEIVVAADGLQQVAESDDTNNERSETVSVTTPPGTLAPGIDVTEPPL